MRFLVDAQLPPALARMLSARGHVAEHITDIGAADAPDSDLWSYALEHGAVLVTKDEDSSTMLAGGGDAPTIVWVRVGNTSRRALLEWFDPLIDRLVATIEAGNTFVELR